MPPTPEALAREQIDEQLIACGWSIQNYKRIDSGAGRGIVNRLNRKETEQFKSFTCEKLIKRDKVNLDISDSRTAPSKTASTSPPRHHRRRHRRGSRGRSRTIFCDRR